MRCLDFIYSSLSVNFVLTDLKSTEIIKYCINNNIPHFIGNPRNEKAYTFVTQYSVDVILSINYLFIIDSSLIKLPRKYAINFHGSLLPKYRGRTPHVWSIINNEKESGITAHIITEECDKGDIIYQEKIQIFPDTTGGALLEQFVQMYPIVINKVTNMIENDQVKLSVQDETLATWFGIRNPDDGQINWNWQKEQLYNWVRAQSRPYPGAFTFYNNIKIIIHKIEFSEIGYNFKQENGTILKGGNQPIIKTPNGAVKLIMIETDRNIEFIKDEKLHERY